MTMPNDTDITTISTHLDNHSQDVTSDTSSHTASCEQQHGRQDADKQQGQPKHLRFINTFMKRRTHMNKHAEHALNDASYQKYLVNGRFTTGSGTGAGTNTDTNIKTDSSSEVSIAHITNLRDLFAESRNGKDAPLTLEIGFGMGDSLIEMAIADPTRNFVGIEVHEPGIGKCAFMAGEHALENIKIINGDAIKLLQQLPDNHIDRIQLYFPDPWQKKRHYKRRFVSPERMQIVTRALKQGGWFHTATDWEHYAHWMLQVLDNFTGLDNLAGAGQFTPRPEFRPMTKFERRGIERGHGVWDLIYRKQ